MNIVIVAHPKHEIIGPLHLGPTRRSVIFVPCNGYQQRIAQELVARATQLHVVLNADRTKDTDVVSVPHYHISMSLLDASPIGRPTPVTWLTSLGSPLFQFNQSTMVPSAFTYSFSIARSLTPYK